MRVAICEDRKEDAKRLLALLDRYIKTRGLVADADLFESGEAFLAAFEPGRYQIIFMDIFMAPHGLNGMDTAERLRARDEEAAVIFTTTSEDYGIEGYNVAQYYIVKPVTEADFLRAMKKCRAKAERYGKAIEITVNRQPVALRLCDILYVEAQRKNCVFMTAQGELRASMAFDSLIGALSAPPFLRCHRSYIVNLTHVSDLCGMVFIIGGTHKVPVSRGFLPEVQRRFRQFLKEELKGAER